MSAAKKVQTVVATASNNSAPAEIAIVAALPREIAGLVRGLRPDPALLPQGIRMYRRRDAVLVAAGMGAARAALAVDAALRTPGIKTVISCGLAGSCTPELPAGSVAEASLVIDAHTGERLQTVGASWQVLVSTVSIAGVAEKHRLHATYGASMVDMEAATVCRLALAHGLQFRAIKGISDAHDFEIASLSRFSDSRGQFRTAAFALHIALRPNLWRSAVRLGRESQRALTALWAELESVLAARS